MKSTNISKNPNIIANIAKVALMVPLAFFAFSSNQAFADDVVAVAPPADVSQTNTAVNMAPPGNVSQTNTAVNIAPPADVSQTNTAVNITAPGNVSQTNTAVNITAPGNVSQTNTAVNITAPSNVSQTNTAVNTSTGGGSPAVTPSTPPSTSGGSSSGRSGGRSSGGGSGIFVFPATTTLATSTVATSTSTGTSGSCTPYLAGFLGNKFANPRTEVVKLQEFLKKDLNIPLNVTGTYDNETTLAVMAFQNKYTNDVLRPWKVNTPSGLVYISSLKKINSLACNSAFALSADELATINSAINASNTPTEIFGANTTNTTGNTIAKTPAKPTTSATSATSTQPKRGLVANALLSVPAKVGGFLDKVIHLFIK